MQVVTDPEKGLPGIVDAVRVMLEYHPELRDVRIDYDGLRSRSPTSMLRLLFTGICEKARKPLVVLFDEAGCLSNGTLIAFLRQLRDGYVNRARIPFIHSCALVGLRNIRDYKARLRGNGDTLGSASPFNIVKRALTLRNFTRGEIAELYGQHTADTGQAFGESAIDRAHY